MGKRQRKKVRGLRLKEELKIPENKLKLELFQISPTHGQNSKIGKSTQKKKKPFLFPGQKQAFFHFSKILIKMKGKWKVKNFLRFLD